MKKNNNAFVKGLCTNHGGKMAGIVSYSTNCMLCPTCIERHKNGTGICKYCYSWRMLQRYKSLREKLTRNTEYITSHIMEDWEIPTLNYMYFRWESFGELQNTTQAINYFKISEKNPGVRFALWSKNPGHIKEAIKAGYSKPLNLNYIYSVEVINPDENAVIDWLADKGYLEFTNAIFCVYDKDYAAAHDIRINCGSKKCINCLICYKPINGLLIVRELKK